VKRKGFSLIGFCLQHGHGNNRFINQYAKPTLKQENINFDEGEPKNSNLEE